MTPSYPDAQELASLDPLDMLGIVRDSPAQWERGLARALAAETVAVPSATAVVVAGMGGSGIAGDVAALAASQSGTVPVIAAKGYVPAAWVGPSTPVIAVSHSGNTEETMAFVSAAHQAGAPVHVVTSGGRLADFANERGCSVTLIQGGLQPRASLPSLVAPVLVTLERWGVIAPITPALAALPELLAEVVAHDQVSDGPAATLASQLVGRTAVFLGGRGVGSLVALRAACQVAENAEEKAFSAEIPEFDHNALVGFNTRDGSGRFVAVAVRDPAEHPRVAARFAPTLAAMGTGVAEMLEVGLPEGLWLTRLASGILTMDLVSVHLALLLRRDPTPVEVLVNLKTTLAGDA